MGLDTSHNCWHGPYSSFNNFRREIASVMGFEFNKMKGFGGVLKWEALPASPLYELLDHSDCDGELDWKNCGAMADALEELIPKLSPYSAEKAQQFILGMRNAFNEKENVIFH